MREKFVHGVSVPDFDHTKEDLLDAIGCTPDDRATIVRKIISGVEPTKRMRPSEQMEHVYNEFSKHELVVLLAMLWQSESPF